jgi:LysM repeat protein
MSRARSSPRRPRPGAARYAAPVAFLLGITVAVLLVRSGLDRPGPATGTTGPVTRASTAPVPPKTHTVTRARTSTTGTSTAGTVAGAEYYTVQTGDTFGSIATNRGIGVDRLTALNPGVSSNALQVGQKLRVK